MSACSPEPDEKTEVHPASPGSVGGRLLGGGPADGELIRRVLVAAGRCDTLQGALSVGLTELMRYTGCRRTEVWLEQPRDLLVQVRARDDDPTAREVVVVAGAAAQEAGTEPSEPPNRAVTVEVWGRPVGALRVWTGGADEVQFTDQALGVIARYFGAASGTTAVEDGEPLEAGLRAIALSPSEDACLAATSRLLGTILPDGGWLVALAEPPDESYTVRATGGRFAHTRADLLQLRRRKPARTDGAGGAGRGPDLTGVLGTLSGTSSAIMALHGCEGGPECLIILGSNSPTTAEGALMAAVESVVLVLSSALASIRARSAHRRTAAELTAAERYVEHVRQLKTAGEVAGGFAHYLNNILAAALGNAQLLLARTTDETERRQLAAIERAAQDAGAAAQRVLHLTSRPAEAGTEAADPVAAVRQSLATCLPAGATRDVGLQVELAPVPPVAVPPRELVELVSVLLTNALEAVGEGGRITVRTSTSGDGQVVLEVSDNGPGMSDTTSRDAFKPFFSTKPEHEGVGLSIARGIARRAGGGVLARSAPGQGTTMSVTLPASPAAPAQVAPSAEPSPLRVLLADDEDILRMVMAEALRSVGYEVETAATGGQALTAVGESAFDVVITDLTMPDYSGWEVAAAARAANPPAGVIVLTGWTDRTEVPAQYASRVDRLLQKPVDIHALSAAVAEIAASRAGQDGSERACA